MDNYVMNMLIQCKGDTLLPYDIQSNNAMVTIRYERKGAVAFSQYYQTKKMDYRHLTGFLLDLCKCHNDIEDCLLPLDGLLMNPEHVFYHAGKQKVFFCYHPQPREDGISFCDGFKYIVEFCMKVIDYTDSQAVECVYDIYQRLMDGGLDIRQIRDIVDKSLKPELAEQPILIDTGFDMLQEELTRHKTESSSGDAKWKIGIVWFVLAGISGAIGMYLLLRRVCFQAGIGSLRTAIIFFVAGGILIYCGVESYRKHRWSQILQRNADIIDEHPVVSDISREISKSDVESVQYIDTCVLSVGQNEVSGCWILQGIDDSSESICIRHFPAVVGRQKEEVDYVISENGVSRRHLMLFSVDNELLIEDLGSTNGTYVNNKRIKVMEPCQVIEGDQIDIGPRRYRLCAG